MRRIAGIQGEAGRAGTCRRSPDDSAKSAARPPWTRIFVGFEPDMKPESYGTTISSGLGRDVRWVMPETWTPSAFKSRRKAESRNSSVQA